VKQEGKSNFCGYHRIVGMGTDNGVCEQSEKYGVQMKLTCESSSIKIILHESNLKKNRFLQICAELFNHGNTGCVVSTVPTPLIGKRICIDPEI